MSSKRPTQIPRWAWGSSAALVQPPSGAAEAGFATRMEPPAQWLNWYFNSYGAWIDFLRGPQVEQWSRVQWPGTPASDHFDAPSALALAVDTAASDAGAADAAFRMAVVGEVAGPAARMFVSQRGTTWEARANLPTGVTGPFALKALSTGRWLLAALDSGGTPRIYYATGDNGTAAGPIGNNANTWTAATVPAGMDEVKALAELAGTNHFAATAGGGAYSGDNGATWLDSSFTSSPSGAAVHAVSTGVKYVWVSADGEIFNSGDGATFVATVTLGGGASAAWRLCGGAAGEVLAYRVGQSTVVDLYFSEDNGASWSTLAQGSTAPKYITQVAYHDGVWVASSSRSPWLWVSNDAVSWRALSPPVDTSASPAALYAVAWEGGAWVALGNGFSLQCGRAADPATGADVASDAPATLSDAGSLRGRRIATTTPTTGQVLIYNSTSGLWEPGSAGSTSPTTTRGDLIRRGASADQRLPAASADTFVGGDGTDVTTRTAAQVVESLQSAARTLPQSLPVGATWTASNGLGTATASTLTLTVPGSTVATTHANMPRLTAPHSRDPWQIEVVARLAAFTGGTNNTFARLILADSSGNAWLTAQSRGDGELSLADTGGFLAAYSSAFALAGSDWFRVVIRDGYVTVFTGTGSAGSQAWTRRYQSTPGFSGASASNTYTLVRLDLYVGVGAPGTVTTQWADVIVRGL